MPSNRAKGMSYVREVRKILEAKGYRVEGPGQKVIYINKKPISMHKDYFDGFDLLSYRETYIKGHQITTIENKSSRAKKMRDLGLIGYLWCRVKGPHYRIWFIGWAEEPEEIFESNL